MQISHKSQDIDVRVSTVPGRFGEKIVLRLLTRSLEFLQLANLGMQAADLALFQQSISQPNGIILITVYWPPNYPDKITELNCNFDHGKETQIELSPS